MTQISRRTLLGAGLSSAAAWAIAGRGARAEDTPAEPALPVDKAHVFGLPEVGSVKPVPSKAIEASPLGVGFEVLDRKCFDPEKAYPHLAALGAKWARCQTGWNRCEPRRSEFTFQWLDEVVDSLLEIGVQPWFNLGYGNRIYIPAKPDEQSVGWAPIFDEDVQEAWLRFVDKLAEHFADRVKHWEIWNEPNIRGFWKPEKPNAADYVKLVRVTAPQIRKRVPHVVIVGGAYAGMPMGYIQACFEAGMGDLVDRVSYHPYRAVPEAGYEGQVQELRAMAAAHNPKIKLWQGENGCPSRGGKGSMGALTNLVWNETRQAKWLLRRILTDLRLEVELTSYFHTVDLQGYRTGTNYKGLLRGGQYTPKPSYYAYQCLCALFDARTSALDLKPELVGQKRVKLQDAGFAREGSAMYAWWSPASLQEPWEAKPITVRLTLPQGAKMDRPVLIDPLSRRVFRYAAVKREGASLVLERLPLLDYPLLMADAETVAA